jgi:hypothetical protein
MSRRWKVFTAAHNMTRRYTNAYATIKTLGAERVAKGVICRAEDSGDCIM